jgi:glycine cleavage system regulatory protein
VRGLRIGCADLSHLATLGDAVVVLPQTAVSWQLATDVSEQLAAPSPGYSQ